MAATLSPSRLAGLAILMTGVLGASPPGELPKRVKVTVVTILATDKSDEVDKRLEGIAAEVKRTSPQLKGFKLVSMASKSLAVDEMASFSLVEEQTTQVVVRHSADANNRVSLTITPPRQGKITYRSVCDKFLPIVTRYQTRDKERLILAVRVQPCNGK